MPHVQVNRSLQEPNMKYDKKNCQIWIAIIILVWCFLHYFPTKKNHQTNPTWLAAGLIWRSWPSRAHLAWRRSSSAMARVFPPRLERPRSDVVARSGSQAVKPPQERMAWGTRKQKTSSNLFCKVFCGSRKSTRTDTNLLKSLNLFWRSNEYHWRIVLTLGSSTRSKMTWLPPLVSEWTCNMPSNEPRKKKNSYFPLYCLFEIRFLAYYAIPINITGY